ncbi:hypothetical protein EDD18DRAFT_1116743 [Armillaria luteobubalina]|uniref:Uncharacterized protein n=1 Tax=Armillaria luteobubalina TaxID=153913 RepID=A0AA39TZJ7_9AGAR|nr:hypothetical protein EDD18DRAFT_1116743 [Armillaria luteobubalina]
MVMANNAAKSAREGAEVVASRCTGAGQISATVMYIWKLRYQSQGEQLPYILNAPAFVESQIVLESDPAVLPQTLRYAIVQLGLVIPKAKVLREFVYMLSSGYMFLLRKNGMEESLLRGTNSGNVDGKYNGTRRMTTPKRVSQRAHLNKLLHWVDVHWLNAAASESAVGKV